MKGVYGGTYRLFERLRKQTSGTTFSYVDLNDLASVEGFEGQWNENVR
ncbi:hypothetical protein [Escherichia coli]|nr:hypothetical protein [Escherichia coli]